MKTEYQKCLDGEPYDGAAPELAEMTLRTKRLISRLRSIDYDDAEAKRAVYEQMFGSIGSHVYIDIDFRCEYGRHIRLGNNVIINKNCTLLDDGLINIGDNVMIAPDVNSLREACRAHACARKRGNVDLRHNSQDCEHRQRSVDRWRHGGAAWGDDR